MECHFTGMSSNCSLRNDAVKSNTECVDCIGIELVENHGWHVSQMLNNNSIVALPMKWLKRSVVGQTQCSFLVQPNCHAIGMNPVKKDANIFKGIYAIICAM